MDDITPMTYSLSPFTPLAVVRITPNAGFSGQPPPKAPQPYDFDAAIQACVTSKMRDIQPQPFTDEFKQNELQRHCAAIEIRAHPEEFRRLVAQIAHDAVPTHVIVAKHLFESLKYTLTVAAFYGAAGFSTKLSWPLKSDDSLSSLFRAKVNHNLQRLCLSEKTTFLDINMALANLPGPGLASLVTGLIAGGVVHYEFELPEDPDNIISFDNKWANLGADIASTMGGLLLGSVIGKTISHTMLIKRFLLRVTRERQLWEKALAESIVDTLSKVASNKMSCHPVTAHVLKHLEERLRGVAFSAQPHRLPPDVIEEDPIGNAILVLPFGLVRLAGAAAEGAIDLSVAGAKALLSAAPKLVPNF